MQTGATMTDANVPLQFKWMGRVVCMLVCLVSVVGVILAEVGPAFAAHAGPNALGAAVVRS